MGLFRRRRSDQEEPPQALSTPHIILAGVGVHNRLQLTVETQRLLARYGKAFAIGLPPALRPFLKTSRVEVVDLDSRFSAGRRFEDIYLDIVAYLIERTAVERPVILLCPGNPLFLNSVARALVMESRRLGLTLQILPGVSLLDVLINDIGVDVGLFGLQVFDAHWLVQNDLPLSPRLPALILNLAGFGREMPALPDDAPEHTLLLEHLRRYYAPEQVVTLITIEPAGGFAFIRDSLDGLASNGTAIASATCFFIDATPRARQEAAGNG